MHKKRKEAQFSAFLNTLSMCDVTPMQNGKKRHKAEKLDAYMSNLYKKCVRETLVCQNLQGISLKCLHVS